MHNPYLSGHQKVTFWSELRRLFGSPVRFISSLVFFVIPLLMGLAGLYDWGQSLLYTSKNKVESDPRPGYFFVDCLKDKTLCQGSEVKVKLWPFDLGKVDLGFYSADFTNPDPGAFGGLLTLAILGFVSVGNPRWAEIFGGENGDPALPLPEKPPIANWVLGGVVQRNWKPDPGQFVLNRGRMLRPYVLTAGMVRTNLLLIAPPGSGKTTGVVKPFIQFAAANHHMALVFDSKGRDFEPGDFDLNFDLNDYEHSFHLHLFGAKTPGRAGEQLGEALIPTLNEDKAYFSEVAKNSMSALVEGHHAVYGRFPELPRLLSYLAVPTDIEGLMVIIREEVPDTSEAGRLCANLNSILRLMETKGDTLGNLRIALQPLTHPEIARFLVANKEGKSCYNIRELVTRSVLVRLGLPVAEYPKIAPTLGRLILTQFNYAVLSPDIPLSHLKVAVVDEAHNFVTASIAKGMAQARSNNAGFLLATQTLTQIEDETLRETIFAAAGNKLVMNGVGDYDAEKFSRVFGELELPYLTRSEGRNTSGTSGSSSARTGMTTSSGRSTGDSKSKNFSTKFRRIWTPTEIRTLPQYHCLVETSTATGKRYGVQLLDLSIPLVAKLKKQVFGNQKGVADIASGDKALAGARSGRHFKRPLFLPSTTAGTLPVKTAKPSTPILSGRPLIISAWKGDMSQWSGNNHPATGDQPEGIAPVPESVIMPENRPTAETTLEASTGPTKLAETDLENFFDELDFRPAGRKAIKQALAKQALAIDYRTIAGLVKETKEMPLDLRLDYLLRRLEETGL